MKLCDGGDSAFKRMAAVIRRRFIHEEIEANLGRRSRPTVTVSVGYWEPLIEITVESGRDRLRNIAAYEARQ